MKDMLAELNHMLDQRSWGGADFEGHAALRRLLPREPAEPRRAAGGAGPPHGRHAGDAGLDDASSSGRRSSSWPNSSSTTWTCAGRSISSASSAGHVPGDGLGPALQLPGPRIRSAWPRRRPPWRSWVTSTGWSSSAGRRQPRRTGGGGHRPRPGAAGRRFRPQPRRAGLANPHAPGGRTGDQREGRSSSRPRVSAASAAMPCTTCSSAWPATSWAATSWSGRAPGTSAPTRPRPTSSATRSTSTSSARSATPCTIRCGTPVLLSPDDFEVERTEHVVRSSTVLMLDLSLSMPMRDNFLAAKKVAMALHSLISCSSCAITWAWSASARWPARSARRTCPRFRGTSCTAPTCSTRSRSAGASSPASRAPSRSS